MKPLVFFLALFAPPAVYDFAPAQTTVEVVVDSSLHTVHAKFALKRGTLHVDADGGAATGELVVDAASGASGSEGRDHKMTREVLESDKYPDIVFQPDRMDGKLAPDGKSQVKLHGTLTIHGKPHEVTASVDAQRIAAGYDATATFQVPYIDWGMKSPSNFILKVNKVAAVTVHTVVKPAD